MCTTVCTKVHIQSLVFNAKMHHYVLLVLERHSHLPPFTYLVHVFFLNSVFVVIWGQSGLFWKTSVNVTSFCEGFYLRLKRIFALKMKASPAEGNSSVLTCVVGLEGQLVHPPSVDSFLCIHHIILSLWANLFPLLTYSSHLFAFSDRAHFTPSSNKNGHLLCTHVFFNHAIFMSGTKLAYC